MFRMFDDHFVRKQISLCSSYKMEKLSNEGEVLGTYTVTVPSCWQSTIGLEDFRGQCRYSKKINTNGGNIRFVFKGVSHTADVYFDGKHIAHHYNAYTPFDALALGVSAGEHELQIVADNRFSEDSTLHIPNDYYSYGGITRPVIMEEIGDAYIEYLHITPIKLQNSWEAKIEVLIKSLKDDNNLSLKVEVLDKVLDFDVKFCDGEYKAVSSVAFENVNVWSIENPNLYIAKARLYNADMVIDDLLERFGFREIKTEGRKILLNGKQLFIKGFNRHEDFGGIGCAIPENIMNMDIDIILSTGANLIRTSHYPNDERFLDLCDERGVLVWEEAHARQIFLETMSLPNFRKQSANCIEEMITSHYNHPSIILWGILNECDTYSDYAVECYIAQIDQIKSLDKSRPTTQATDKFFKDKTHGLPDIISFNIYDKWYANNNPKAHLDEIKKYVDNNGGNDKPMLISEFGAAAIYGYRSFSEVKWSEERQAKVIYELIDDYSSIDYLSGVIIWQYADARVDSEFREWNSRPKAQNNKGIVDCYRQPKMSYYAVKNSFSKIPTYKK